MRARVIAGVCLTLFGAYLAFDPSGRLQLILGLLGHWWIGFAALGAVLILQVVPSLAARVECAACGAAGGAPAAERLGAGDEAEVPVPIALYYPWMSFRDDKWVKLAC